MDPTYCHALEADHDGWKMPRGLSALGQLAARYPQRFSGTIVTTNFDPLLEIAVRAAGRPAATLAFDHDGSLRPFVVGGGSLPIAHLHGYWDGNSHTLHAAKRLTEPRDQLTGSLRDAFANSLVVVMGYGGWNDVFSGALRALVAERSDIEVVWSLLERRPPNWPAGTLLHELDNAGPGVHIYDGVDANEVLPILAARHDPDPAKRFSVEAPPKSPAAPRKALAAAARAGGLAIKKTPGASTGPDIVVWPQRLREANLIHASQAVVVRSLLEAGARVLAVVNDLGMPRDDALYDRFVTALSGWTATEGGVLEFQRLRDRDALFPRSVTYERWIDVLSAATATRLDIVRTLANATTESAEDPDVGWYRLFSPFIYWMYLLSLKERGIALKRVWTVSGTDQGHVSDDFDAEVEKGTGHLLVTSLHEDSIRSPMDHPALHAGNPDALAKALIAAAGRRRADQPDRLVPWTWRQLVVIPGLLTSDSTTPLTTKHGDVTDEAGLLTALRSRKQRADVAGALAELVAARFA